MEKRIELNNSNAVSESVDTGGVNCSICRNHLMELCIDWQANKSSREECLVARGVCNHAYHFHCISKLLRIKEVCPSDNSMWEFQKYAH